ncbi:hypothetical protein [Mangrovihabitans endophyticus]|uniref:Uncharacterized protein n=1 Tax=Mangrovihabitans endophyticus TaxID=1751298 RepID=A0A8J3BXM8_9ACTN|nr:hypothetical protein GCM10012284_23410 [Mangrovihabitans endophyticus]
MGMMVTGRKVSETPDAVRYEFGLDRQFDRVLTIDKATWQASAEDGRFDSAAGAVVSKIKRAWQEQGEFPPGVVFAS